MNQFKTEWLTIQEAAARIGETVDQTELLLKAKALAGVKVDGEWMISHWAISSYSAPKKKV